MVRTFNAYMDFCYLVRRDIIDENTLDAIDNALSRFHQYRIVFQEAGVREPGPKGFALPRQHSMVHYRPHIQNFGAPNGLCSSITESKHIVAVKKPWRRSNRYEALKQMLVTNERLDKLAAARIDFGARGMLEGTCLSDAMKQRMAARLGERMEVDDDSEGEEDHDDSDDEEDRDDSDDEEDRDGYDEDSDSDSSQEVDPECGEDDNDNDENPDLEDDIEINLDGEVEISVQSMAQEVRDNGRTVRSPCDQDRTEDDRECGPLDGPALFNEVLLARTKGEFLLWLFCYLAN